MDLREYRSEPRAATERRSGSPMANGAITRVIVRQDEVTPIVSRNLNGYLLRVQSDAMKLWVSALSAKHYQRWKWSEIHCHRIAFRRKRCRLGGQPLTRCEKGTLALNGTKYNLSSKHSLQLGAIATTGQVDARAIFN